MNQREVSMCPPAFHLLVLSAFWGVPACGTSLTCHGRRQRASTWMIPRENRGPKPGRLQKHINPHSALLTPEKWGTVGSSVDTRCGKCMRPAGLFLPELHVSSVVIGFPKQPSGPSWFLGMRGSVLSTFQGPVIQLHLGFYYFLSN